jgi:hypothetical protein
MLSKYTPQRCDALTTPCLTNHRKFNAGTRSMVELPGGFILLQSRKERGMGCGRQTSTPDFARQGDRPGFSLRDLR